MFSIDIAALVSLAVGTVGGITGTYVKTSGRITKLEAEKEHQKDLMKETREDVRWIKEHLMQERR